MSADDIANADDAANADNEASPTDVPGSLRPAYDSNGRHPARRAFADEFNDAEWQNQLDNAEKSPKYTLLPTGALANRLLVVGTLSEVEEVGGSQLRARVVDPADGVFFCYAGQYEPNARETLASLETPEYVAVVAKPHIYETEEGNVNAALRPETITAVSEAEREQWAVETAAATLDRVDDFLNARVGDSNLNTRQTSAMAVYGDALRLDDYRETALAALRNIAD